MMMRPVLRRVLPAVIRTSWLSLGILTLLGAGTASADVFSGFLNDPANGALVGSALSAPSFADDFAIANNVALYVLSVATPGDVNFLSKGFGLGGVDPYFTLFSGTGNSATFVGSNYNQAFFGGGGDFHLDFLLAAGDYTIAIGAFANLSFAENLGAGTLGDGFIGLGEPGSLGSSFYELDVSAPTAAAVPEPASVILLMLPGALLVLRRGRSTAICECTTNRNSTQAERCNRSIE
jgi:hypothetical protein